MTLALPGVGLAVVLLAQLGSRPAECAPSARGGAEGGRGTNAWERAKEPNLGRYCDLLASGTAKLVGSAVGPSASQAGPLVKDVPGLADEADKILPGRAAPAVLKGRALLRLGKADEALAALAEARTRDDRALDDPVAALVWARANARTGHRAEAAQAYRAALPRISGLATAERAAAAFEAGLAVMALGTGAIDDAIAMFRQAGRDAQDALAGAATLGLALALERAGAHDEARSVVAERGRFDAKAILADARVATSLADAGATAEIPALLAIAQGSPGAAKKAGAR